ncbi:MAG: hypothetical protein F4X14_06300 [Caldilineaceae bacterium SB0661_bin_32]|uniref:Molybdopterin dehydrogenase FAD-binding domain-containing protein n=1 Tax=Caldilineaceae bacterium SB0661_bin_32 TaxID=2605255 RepID=A0A6B1D4S7_9CHLR|nr:hypothetical protein [Caldilineaceae bacterium SB0661_bin_32]
MARWRACHTPATVSEALSLLHQHQDKARIIAGGADLILDMEAEHASAPEVLVDVTKIGGIDRVAPEDAWPRRWSNVWPLLLHVAVRRERVGYDPPHLD